MTDYGVTVTDETWAETLAQRLEQLRLETNITQKQVADELGVTEKTYRQIIKGKGKFVHIIGLMRLFGQEDQLNNMIPETPYSPMALLKMAGKKRQRASGSRVSESDQPYQDGEALDW